MTTQTLRGLVPAGAILPFAGSTAPAGWLLCDGTAIDSTQYPELSTAIGTNWNTAFNHVTGANWTAPGGTLFRVPDLRGAFIRGVGTPSGLDAVTLAGRQANKTALGTNHGASASVTINSGDATHNHPLNAITSTSSLAGPADSMNLGGSSIYRNSTPNTTLRADAISSVTASHAHTGSVSLSGYTETRPDNVGVNYIISTGK